MIQELKRLADAMYDAAQYLTTDASRLHKAMDDYRQFIINEYTEFRKPVSAEEFKEFVINANCNAVEIAVDTAKCCYTCQRYDPIGFVCGGTTYHYCNRGKTNYPCDPENSGNCKYYKPRKEDK